MNITGEGTAIHLVGGTYVEGAGTITGTGVDWSPYYENQAKLIVNMGASTGGSVIASLQGGTALASGYSTLGTVAANGGAAGTQTYELDVTNITQRYLRAVVTNSAGTVVPSVTVIGKPRTIT
jgi:siroheme synthase